MAVCMNFFLSLAAWLHFSSHVPTVWKHATRRVFCAKLVNSPTVSNQINTHLWNTSMLCYRCSLIKVQLWVIYLFHQHSLLSFFLQLIGSTLPRAHGKSAKGKERNIFFLLWDISAFHVNVIYWTRNVFASLSLAPAWTLESIMNCNCFQFDWFPYFFPALRQENVMMSNNKFSWNYTHRDMLAMVIMLLFFGVVELFFDRID